MPANVVVPEVGESIVDARVAKWLKKEGDVVKVGDPLVELETDKIDLEVAAPQGGVLTKIAHGDGSDVKVGEVLGVIDEAASGKAPAGQAAESAGAKTAEPAPPGPQTSAAASPAAPAPKAGAREAAPAAPPGPQSETRQSETDRKRATPAARNAAQQNAVDLKLVAGSGDAGRVMRRDVEAVVSKPATPLREDRRQGEGDRTEERVRMSKRRATIARRLVEAQSTAAMLTTFNEIDMSAVMGVRERHKQAFKERHGVGLGLTSFFVKASIGALREFPRINAEIQGDEMVLKHYYDIGIAVGAAEGLVVPVLRDADRLSFAQVEQKVRGFAKAAEDGTLSLADLRGGTFTITNGGVFGSLMSTPILNPPQVGILGLHAIKDRPMAIDGQVAIRPMMYVALTYDHRIVDGAEAVQFLVRVKQLVEDPGAMLIE
ncbi:MAG TPA: 2-oxoglutarate dehydrogenase complex dihydrolipoyllysine-residue succinyltransferase [Vicinamibacterales bacterium]|nr:2-oxoglutarate dehydrogenase complex dihydrolipoyllysine-residue succinyltransferase [Vicinamibacterales bacterium]